MTVILFIHDFLKANISAFTTTPTRGRGRSLYVATPTTFLRKDEFDRPDKHRPRGSDPRSGRGDGSPTIFLHGRPTVGLSPRSATPFSSPIYDPKCPSCGEEPQTVEHWLQRCPNAVALRQQLFGEPSPPLSVLTTNPGSVLALARKTLL